MGITNKSQLIILALLVVLGTWAHNAATARTIQGTSVREEEMMRHEQWMSLHGITYAGADEKAKRREVFERNVARIEAFNAANADKPYKLGVNKFADLTSEEFVASRNGFKAHVCEARRASVSTGFRYENASGVPSSMDWRKKGQSRPLRIKASVVIISIHLIFTFRCAF